jgi:hypothetical protein
MSVKPPLVALLMADCFLEPICSGEKKITIREGMRDYKAGQKVVLCKCGNEDDIGWARMATITEVSVCTLKNVDIEDLNADGMKDLDDAVQCLRDFYPNVTKESPVTVIRWELLCQ